jgi:hypothetical protein
MLNSFTQGPINREWERGRGRGCDIQGGISPSFSRRVIETNTTGPLEKKKKNCLGHT